MLSGFRLFIQFIYVFFYFILFGRRYLESPNQDRIVGMEPPVNSEGEEETMSLSDDRSYRLSPLVSLRTTTEFQVSSDSDLSDDLMDFQPLAASSPVKRSPQQLFADVEVLEPEPKSTYTSIDTESSICLDPTQCSGKFPSMMALNEAICKNLILTELPRTSSRIMHPVKELGVVPLKEVIGENVCEENEDSNKIISYEFYETDKK